MTTTERDTRVAQAAGMVSVQAECTVDEAYELLRKHARASLQSLADVAADVVERRTRFSPGD
jgi:AmiR/NasT family two-component response regulator